MRQAALLAFALLPLVVAAAVPAPVAAAPDDGLAPDGVTVVIDIQTDGDARWVVSTSYVLNGSSEVAAFQDVRRRFERGRGDAGFSITPFRTVAPRVAERTGRDMTIRNPSWTGVVRNESGVRRGVLKLSFTWTNFAHVDNETVTLGGAFAGGWFGDLAAHQTLIVKPPSGYEVSNAQPSHETVNGTLRWTGPVEFEGGEPVARFEPTPTQTIPWASITGAVVAALAVGGIIAYAWVKRTRRRIDVEEPAGGSATGEAAEPATGAEEAVRDASGSGSGAGAPDAGASEDAETARDGDAVGEAAAEDAEEAGTGTEPELLSDEERVERLLAEHGGRMKQAKIVDETRWSNAKVSQLLSKMADEGRVEKLRIGRENLISLPDEDESG